MQISKPADKNIKTCKFQSPQAYKIIETEGKF